MRVIAVIVLLFAHLLYAAGAAMAFFDFKSLPSSPGRWPGVFYVVITMVLGFPWSMLAWFFGMLDRALWILWLGLLTNYVILWRITFSALRWSFAPRAQ